MKPARKPNPTPSTKLIQSVKDAGKELVVTTSETEHGLASDVDETKCKVCREGRELVEVPASATDHRIFRKRDRTLRLCPVCDGQALEKALQKHVQDIDLTKP